MYSKTLRVAFFIFIIVSFFSGCSAFKSDINKCPKANAGEDIENVSVGDSVELSGKDSFDQDGDGIIFYQWSLESKPSESEVVLEEEVGETTSFIPDKPGEYVVGLVVSDGTCISDKDNILVIVIEKTFEGCRLVNGGIVDFCGGSVSQDKSLRTSGLIFKPLMTQGNKYRVRLK